MFTSNLIENEVVLFSIVTSFEIKRKKLYKHTNNSRSPIVKMMFATFL